MESHKSFSLRFGLIWFSLGIFILFQNARAKENKTDPIANVNLCPIQGWRSAYYCLNHTAPAHCATISSTGQLTDQGIIDVLPNEVGEYCSAASGCAQHALDVLKCIHLVKRDFWFHHNATVPFLNKTIIDGCASNNSAISTLDYKSSGMKVYQTIYVPLIASLSTLAFIVMSNII